MDHRKHAARSRERMKAYASGGAVPSDDDRDEREESESPAEMRREKLDEVMKLKSNPKEPQQ